MPLTIRTMTPTDIGFAMALKDHAGWNQTPADWSRLLALEPAGCFVAQIDGEPVGTGTVTTYAGDLAWIGMILVHPARRRLGVGGAVVNACVDYARSRGVRTIKLDATPLGNRLYVTMGFAEEYAMARLSGRGRRGETGTSPCCRPMGEADLDDCVAYDAASFGVARPGVIQRFAAECPELAFVARDAGGRATGLILGRPGQAAHQIGPWSADSPAIAESLLQAALAALGDWPALLDTVAPNRDAGPLLTRYGFTEQRPFVRMVLGETGCAGRPERTYAVSGVEKG